MVHLKLESSILPDIFINLAFIFIHKKLQKPPKNITCSSITCLIGNNVDLNGENASNIYKYNSNAI